MDDTQNKTEGNLPSISFVIPVYNAGRLFEGLLESIRSQDYPRNKIEIVASDGGSTDETVEIARKYDCRVVDNAMRFCEPGTSVGFQNATNELVCIIAADNRLPQKDWLKSMIKPFLENEDLVAAEPVWFKYDREGSPSDRYCALFGNNDPVAFYLKRRDRLMQTETRWNLPGEVIKDNHDYFLIRFSRDDLPTVGSQGFLIKRNLLLKTNYKPYLFHIDSNLELVEMGYDRYAMVKQDIIHLHSKSAFEFLQKLKRNFDWFIYFNPHRKYKWQTSRLRLAAIAIMMLTFIKPMYDAVRGYSKIHDIAWFLHPLFCFCVVFIYGFATVKWQLVRLIGRE